MYGLMKSRSARWMLGFTLGLGAVAPWVAAKEETIEMEKVPKHIRHEIENYAKGGSHIVVIMVREEEPRPSEDYYVRFESADGKQMKMRIAPNGRVLEEGETRAQRHKDEEARLAEAKSDAERARIQASLAAEREAEDRAQFQAAQAACATAAAAHHGPPSYAG